MIIVGKEQNEGQMCASCGARNNETNLYMIFAQAPNNYGAGIVLCGNCVTQIQIEVNKLASKEADVPGDVYYYG